MPDWERALLRRGPRGDGVAARQVLTGIVFVPRREEDLPGQGSGNDVLATEHEWTERGVWLFILQHLYPWWRA